MIDVVFTVLIGALPPAIVTALTSWWNRDTARTQLERERLRQQQDDDDR